MSFSKIQLPNTVITDFYQHSLVLIDNEIAGFEMKERALEVDEDHKNISGFQQPNESANAAAKPLVVETIPEASALLNKIQDVQVSDTTDVATSTKAGAKINSQNKKWFLGDNKKNITFVVNDAEAVYLRDESLELLTKLLPALKLNLGDVAIINTANEPVDARKIKHELNATLVVMFGVKCEQIDLPFKIPDYKEQQFNVCRYIQLPALDKLLGESVAVRTEKSKVWVELKKLFGV